MPGDQAPSNGSDKPENKDKDLINYLKKMHEEHSNPDTFEQMHSIVSALTEEEFRTFLSKHETEEAEIAWDNIEEHLHVCGECTDRFKGSMKEIEKE